MIAYRLVLSRRHLYEVLRDGAAVAQIAFRGSSRAAVISGKRQFDLEAFEGVRKRVVRSDDHDHDSTIARASSLGHYAIDLSATTLYWHSLPGRARAYCWMKAEGVVVARYLPAAGGDFRVEFEEGFLSPADEELAVILGSYLLTRIGMAVGPDVEPAHAPQSSSSQAHRETSGDS